MEGDGQRGWVKKGEAAINKQRNTDMNGEGERDREVQI